MAHGGADVSSSGFYRAWMGKKDSPYPDFAVDIVMWRKTNDEFAGWTVNGSGDYE